MRYRVALWAGAGFLIAGFWAFYLFPIALPIVLNSPIIEILARATCPVVLLGSYFHVGLHVSWVLLANAASYALAALMIESLRQELNPAK
jgi:hypothetical protein